MCTTILHTSPFHVQYVTLSLFFFFFFNDTATTEIYTLSLHDALPICWRRAGMYGWAAVRRVRRLTFGFIMCPRTDRKSTRLNSSHLGISYAVFCLKKKKKTKIAENMNQDTKITRRRYQCIQKDGYN